MRELPLNALRAFAAVYDAGGIRPAARALQVAHSAVSRHVRELESWLGVPLIEPRGLTRPLVFTPQGEALGRAGLASLRELAGAVASLREARPGNAVTLSTTPSVAARWLLPRLGALETALPWIELSVVAEQKLADPAEEGVDLTVRMGRGPWPGLDCTPLMDDALFPVMTRAYWHAAGRPSTPSGLVRLRLLHDRDASASWSAWRAAFGPKRFNVRPGPRYASSDLVLRAASQGAGVALARGRLVTDDLRAGNLVRPLGARQVEVPDAYWIVLSAGAPRRAAVSALIEWLHRQAQDKDPAAS